MSTSEKVGPWQLFLERDEIICSTLLKAASHSFPSRRVILFASFCKRVALATSGTQDTQAGQLSQGGFRF